MSELNDGVIKLLWVEDQATEGALLNCTQTLEKTDLFDLTIIANASTAEECILSNSYDKIIFDIRILPGNNKFWEEEHNSFNLKLGIKLIERVFNRLQENKTPYGLITIEDWISIKKRVLKIDPKFNETIQYRHKDTFVYANTIIQFINNLK